MLFILNNIGKILKLIFREKTKYNCLMYTIMRIKILHNRKTNVYEILNFVKSNSRKER